MFRRLVTLDPEWAQVSVNGWAPLAYPPWALLACEDGWALLACEDGGFLPERIPVWYTHGKYSVRAEYTLGLPQLDS